MSALVIDTSSWVSYLAGHGHPAVEEALEDGRVYLPPVVAAELLSGKMSDRHRGQLEALLRDLPLCDASLSHWLSVGRLRARLLAEGISVSTPDAHVAQCAIELDGDLLTEDSIFKLIAKHEGLRLARSF